jgi:membrane protease YdiL (CAAX protease family)
MQPQTSRQQTLTYILLVFLFNVPFDYFMIRAHSIRAGGLLYVWGIMWCPALAVMAVLKLNGRKLSELGWGWGKPKYQLMAWLIPLLYATTTYLIVWASRLGAVPNPEFVQHTTTDMGLNMSRWLSMVIYVLLTGSFGLVISVAAALGEEIGWRGFMVPELAKTTSFTVTALVSGTVWAVGHYPSLLFSDYNGGTPAWYGIPCFTAGIVAMSFVLLGCD